MDEKRTEARHRAFKGAEIIFHDRSSTISCIVRDLTHEGARLGVPSVIGIPDRFTLTLDDHTHSWDCVVVWRSPTALGVHFETSTGAADPASSRQHH